MTDNPKAAELDGENKLLWRFPVQRLSGEAVRDAVLAVSGRLNSESGGLPVYPPLPEGLDEGQKVQGVNTWETLTDLMGVGAACTYSSVELCNCRSSKPSMLRCLTRRATAAGSQLRRCRR